MISLTLRLIIFAKAEVAELGAAWVSEQVVPWPLASGLQLELESDLSALA